MLLMAWNAPKIQPLSFTSKGFQIMNELLRIVVRCWTKTCGVALLLMLVLSVLIRNITMSGDRELFDNEWSRNASQASGGGGVPPVPGISTDCEWTSPACPTSWSESTALPGTPSDASLPGCPNSNWGALCGATPLPTGGVSICFATLATYAKATCEVVPYSWYNLACWKGESGYSNACTAWTQQCNWNSDCVWFNHGAGGPCPKNDGCWY